MRRALLIGCGKIAGGYNRDRDDALVLTHALAYWRHPGFTLAACVDPDPTARSEFSERWAAQRTFATLDEALRSDKYDIASVCGPTGMHLDTIEKLLDAGIPAIFAEKPLDANAMRARDIAARCEHSGCALSVNFTRRWDTAMQDLRAEIASGTFGELRSVVGWYGRGAVNNGSHMIDLVTFLTGRKARIESVTGSLEDGVPGDPSVGAILDLEGAPFHLVVADGRDQARFEATLSFSGGVVEILEGGLYLRRRPAAASAHFPQARVAQDAPRQPTGYGRALLNALDEFSQWQPGEPFASNAVSAIASIETAAALRSAAGHQP